MLTRPVPHAPCSAVRRQCARAARGPIPVKGTVKCQSSCRYTRAPAPVLRVHVHARAREAACAPSHGVRPRSAQAHGPGGAVQSGRSNVLDTHVARASCQLRRSVRVRIAALCGTHRLLSPLARRSIRDGTGDGGGGSPLAGTCSTAALVHEPASRRGRVPRSGGVRHEGLDRFLDRARVLEEQLLVEGAIVEAHLLEVREHRVPL